MALTLTVTAGPGAGLTIDVDRELVLGREGAEVTISDSEMSRRHAVLRPAGGGIEIEDLGSLNGTFVNGQKISAPTPLEAGATVKLGNSQIAVEGAGPQVTQAAAVPDAPPAAGPPRGGLPMGAVLGGLLALVTLVLIVVFFMAARGPDKETETLDLTIQAAGIRQVQNRQLVAGPAESDVGGKGSALLDLTLAGPPDEVLKGPTPFSTRFAGRFANGSIIGVVSGTITPTPDGGGDSVGRLLVTDGTGDFENARGSGSYTGDRTGGAVVIDTVRIDGEIEF